MYAKNTKVAPEKSRQEIERTLIRYGATAFHTGWEQGKAWIMFRAKGREVRFVLPLPDRLKNGAEQEERRRWRAMLMVIKAKLEAVQSGIVSFEVEFMPHTVVPGDGRTVHEVMNEPLTIAYKTGEMPKLLPAPSQPTNQ
jgi:hypothetical protein